MSADHDMSGWARSGQGKWHQVRTMGGRAFFPCMSALRAVDEVMDYRWRPPSGERCQRPFCQIDPGP